MLASKVKAPKRTSEAAALGTASQLRRSAPSVTTNLAALATIQEAPAGAEDDDTRHSVSSATRAVPANPFPRNIRDFQASDLRALKVADYAGVDGRYIAIVGADRFAPYWTIGVPTEAPSEDGRIMSLMTLDYPIVPAKAIVGKNDKMDMVIRVPAGEESTRVGVKALVEWCVDAVHSVRGEAFRAKSVSATENALELANGDQGAAASIDRNTTASWCGSPWKAGAEKGNDGARYDPTLRVKVSGWSALVHSVKTETSKQNKQYVKSCEFLPRIWNADAGSFAPPLRPEDTVFYLYVGTGENGKLKVMDKTPVVSEEGHLVRDAHGRVLRRAVSPADAKRGYGVYADVKAKVHIGSDAFQPVLTALRVVLFPSESRALERAENAAYEIVDAEDADADPYPAFAPRSAPMLALLPPPPRAIADMERDNASDDEAEAAMMIAAAAAEHAAADAAFNPKRVRHALTTRC